MSTKVSLKSGDAADGRPGFHLYEEIFEALDAEDAGREACVYLRLDGVAAWTAPCAGGQSVIVEIHRETARTLGLVA